MLDSRCFSSGCSDGFCQTSVNRQKEGRCPRFATFFVANLGTACITSSLRCNGYAPGNRRPVTNFRERCSTQVSLQKKYANLGHPAEALRKLISIDGFRNRFCRSLNGASYVATRAWFSSHLTARTFSKPLVEFKPFMEQTSGGCSKVLQLACRVRSGVNLMAGNPDQSVGSNGLSCRFLMLEALRTG